MQAQTPGPYTIDSKLLLCPLNPIGERSIVMSVSVAICVCVCLSAIISSELQVRSSPNFLCLLPMAYFLQCFDAVGWAAGRASGL